MNTIKRYALVFSLTLLAVAAVAAAAWAAPGDLPGAAHPALSGSPTVVAYQGEVKLSGAPYTGSGYFKFAVVNAAGDSSYWSNDGSSAGGSEPTAAVELTVREGLFGVLLGDTTLPGMAVALTAAVFSQPETYLRVWFSATYSGTFSQLTPDTPIAAVPYALQAQEADTLDGLHGSQLMTQPQNVVMVAKSGGDYTSVQAAIDGINDAAAGNPYLVWVAPGVYEEQVTMKPYVHLQGAGQETTVISSTASSAWPPTQATLLLASDASLRDLTIGNGGAGDRNVALLATAGVTRTLAADVTVLALGGGLNNYAIFLNGWGTGVTLQQVTALGENGNFNYGLYNREGSAVTLSGGSFTGRGENRGNGIYNSGTLKAESVTALGEDGSTNTGLNNNGDALATLDGGSFTGRGGTHANGIVNSGSSPMLEAENVTALGEFGSAFNHGLKNEFGALATLHGGSFTGRGGTDTRGIKNSDSNTTLEAESITATGEDGSNFNYGLYNADSAAARLRGGSFTGRGGTGAGGIYNAGINTTLEAENVTALGEDSSNANRGLYNESGAAATLRGGSFTGRGGSYARGIHNTDSGTTLEAESVTALGEDGSTNNYGLYNIDLATANVTQSVLEGATNPALNGTGSLIVSNSRLVSPNPVAGSVTCVLVTRGTGAAAVSTDGSTCP